MVIEYGIMSNRHSITADNKLTAYAAILIQYSNAPGLVSIYSPEECRADSWLLAEDIEKRLDEIFGGDGFYAYLNSHKAEIEAALATIKRLV